MLYYMLRLNSFFSPILYLTVKRVCLNYKNCFFTNGIYPTENTNPSKNGCHGKQDMTNSLTHLHQWHYVM